MKRLQSGPPRERPARSTTCVAIWPTSNGKKPKSPPLSRKELAGLASPGKIAETRHLP